jgi:hypothetical protein
MTDNIPSSDAEIDPLTHDRVDQVVLGLSLGDDASFVYLVDSPCGDDETEYLTSVHDTHRFYPVLVTLGGDEPRWRRAQDDDIIWAIRQGIRHIETPPSRLVEHVEAEADAIIP